MRQSSNKGAFNELKQDKVKVTAPMNPGLGFTKANPQHSRGNGVTVIHLVLVTVILSALLFGAVEPWSLAVIGILTAIIFAGFASRWDNPYGKIVPTRVFVCGGIIIAYALFQLIPLPSRWLGSIHPALRQLLIVPDNTAKFIGSVQDAALLKTVPALHPLSVYPFATEMELARLTIYFMIFLLAALAPRSHEDIYSVLRMLVLFGFALALFAVVQKATWNGKLYWLRELSVNRGNPFGPFVNRNHFAGWMCMVAPLSIGLGLMSRSASRRIRYTFFAVVMALTIFCSLSRGGIISFLAGILTLTLIDLRWVSSKKSLVPLLGFLLLVSIYLCYLGASPIIERFAQAGLSSHERVIVWSASLRAFMDFPIFGTGLGTFCHIFPMYKPDTVETFYRYAHNDYIQTLVELGIVGALLVPLFLGSAGKHILGGSWRGRERHLKAGIVASLVSIAVFSFLDFNLHVPSNAILLSFILGLAVAMSRTDGFSNRVAVSRRPT